MGNYKAGIIILLLMLSAADAQQRQTSAGEKTVCLGMQDIGTAELNHLDSVAVSLLRMIVDLQTEQLWQNCDPVFQNGISRKQFGDFTHTLAERIVSLDRLIHQDSKLVKITGEITAPKVVECGAGSTMANDPLQLKVWPGTRNLAAMFYSLHGGELSHRVVLVMAQQNNDVYRLLSLYVTPSAIRTNGAAYYHGLAQKSFDAQSLISSYWFFQCASLLSQTGPVVENGRSLQLQQALTSLHKIPGFQQALTRLTIEDTDYPVYTFYFIEMTDQLVPLVAYLSKYGNADRNTETASKIEVEAQQICKKIKDSNPLFFKEFTTVMFQAYFEPPKEATKSYPYFKVLVNSAALNL